MKQVIKFLPIVFLSLSYSTNGDELNHYRGLIHIHSTYSGGEKNLSEIVEKAQADGIKFIIFGDYALTTINYGFRPFRNLLRIKHRENGVFNTGIDKYFDEIRSLAEKNSTITLIPAIEYSPFYFWDGSIFDGSLTLRDWDKQLLVVPATDDTGLFDELPVLNGKFTKRNLKYYFPTFFVFLLALLISLPIIISKSRYKYVAMATSFVSLICVLNNLPFRSSKYNPYSGSKSTRPYQEFINYANELGFLSFWTHIDGGDVDGYMTSKFPILNALNGATKHPSVLIETNGYTGFEAFSNDTITATNPGREWDQELLSYIRRESSYPAWAIGGIGCKDKKTNDDPVNSLVTVVMAPDSASASILTALSTGKNYTYHSIIGKNVILDHFGVKSIGEKIGLSGDTITAPLQPEIFVSMSMEDLSAATFTVTLIRSGKVATELKCETPCKLSYVEESYIEEPGFYRLIAKSDGITLLSNPIFYFPEQ